MKRQLASLILFIATALGAFAQTPDLLVTMPVPPSTLERLDERSGYIIQHFWDTFNPKSSFSNLQALDRTMGQFFGIAPYAPAEDVHASIDHLIAIVGKAKADNLVTLAEIAERHVYGDTADIHSEELLYPFVKAVATTKKVKSPLKARYTAIYKQLDNSQIGMIPADFTYTRPDGTTGTLSENKTPYTLLFFYDPDCLDCRMAKARLSADIALPALIDNGQLSIMAIYPDEPTAEWREDAKGLPANWIVGAYPEADQHFTMEMTPEIYFLDKEHKILAKDILTDNILSTFSRYINY